MSLAFESERLWRMNIVCVRNSVSQSCRILLGLHKIELNKQSCSSVHLCSYTGMYSNTYFFFAGRFELMKQVDNDIESTAGDFQG